MGHAVLRESSAQVTRPIEGMRVAVTRAAEQCAELSDKLRAQGAIPVEWPMIALAAPLDRAPLDAAIHHLIHFDWIVFSSANGVKFFCAPADTKDDAPRTTGSPAPAGTATWPGLLCVAAVGSQTAAALRSRGWPVDAVPDEFLAANVAAAMGELEGLQILVVQPESAPGDLAEALRERGGWVTEVAAYRNVPSELGEPVDVSQVDVVTLASASAAMNFAARLGGQRLGSVRIVTIGPSTSAAARRAGLPVDAEADNHTLDGLVETTINLVNQG